jgi:ribosomal protein S27E
MEALDGNAIGGLLLEVFSMDMTMATGTCDNCGAVGLVAEFAVYRQAPGTVVRCPACEHVLMVFSQVRGVNCVDLRGLRALTAPG